MALRLTIKSVRAKRNQLNRQLAELDKQREVIRQEFFTLSLQCPHPNMEATYRGYHCPDCLYGSWDHTYHRL